MQNITENNKLIAEFMAGEKDKQVYIKHLNAWYDNCMGYKYNTDWNWLMEVVEKCLIGEAEHSQDEAKKAISEIYESLCSINISAVYNACIGFIKWYNQQK